jgi:hypothetical protein
MKIRGKFTCESVTPEHGNETVRLRAVYAGEKNAEDNTFSEATPSAEVTMTISNKSAHGAFVPGKQYYADFSPAE